MNILEKTILDPTNKAQHSIIWLHGLGADGSDFVPIAKQLNLPNTRFIFPHAPYRKVTANNGYEMRAWYDIYGFGGTSKQDEVGIRAMQQQIDALIADEIALGIAPGKIVLAGFSQGGAMVLHTALRYLERLAGVIALSTYLALKDSLVAEASAANHHIPIFMAHGQLDNVISLETALQAKEKLLLNDFKVDWHVYPMAHSVNEVEIIDMHSFLVHVLGIENA